LGVGLVLGEWDWDLFGNSLGEREQFGSYFSYSGVVLGERGVAVVERE